MIENEMFSSTRTCEIVGISYRQLDYWAREGYFEPTSGANGSGSRRGYSFTDLVKLRVIKDMLDSGWALKQIRVATDFLNKIGMDVGNADLIVSKDNVVLQDENNNFMELVGRPGQGMLTYVPVTAVVQSIREQIAPPAQHIEKSFVA